MDNSNNNETGFHTRAAALLNNQTFSDLEIHVKDGNSQKTFLAHKLFLAMGSQEFANIFYGNAGSPTFIKIFDYKPQTVYLMLQYLYTDKCDLTVEEAKNLYRLAKKFNVSDLEKYCVAYLSKEEPTLENIFDQYDFALSENIPHVLRICRYLVSSQTIAVLKSPQFTEAPLPVVEDILKLDTLSVESELNVISASIKWANQECLRRGAQSDSLRICLYPLFKYLRFLTLTATEFCDFVEQNDNILNSHESTMLTMAILQPGSASRLPPGFSSNCCSRVFVEVATPPSKATKVMDEEKTKPRSNIMSHSVNNNNFDGLFVKPAEKTKKFDLEFAIKEQLRGNYGFGKPSELDQKLETKTKYSEPTREVDEPVSVTKKPTEWHHELISALEHAQKPHVKNLEPNRKVDVSVKSVRPAKEFSYEFKSTSEKAQVKYSEPTREVDGSVKSMEQVREFSLEQTQKPRTNHLETTRVVDRSGNYFEELRKLDYEFKSASVTRDVEYINQNNKTVGLRAENESIEQNNKHVYNPSSGYRRSDSTPNYPNKVSPVLKVSPQFQMNPRRTFEFPLRNLEKEVNSAFPSDIKCSADIHLLKGGIEIYGLELKIQGGSDPDELIEAFLNLSASNGPSKSEVYEDKVKNGVYSMHFSEPVKLAQNDYLHIEVIVEDLVLNRLSGSSSDKCELNSGFNLKAEITMKSNQQNELRDFFYLISRLLYKPL